MPGASGTRKTSSTKGRGLTARNRGGTRGGTGRGSETDVNLVARGAPVGSAKRGVGGVTRSRGSHGEFGQPTNTRIPEAQKERDEYHLRRLAKYQSTVEGNRNVERAHVEEQDKTIRDLQQANDDLRARTNMYSNTIQELRNENDELKIRLSSHFGAKLQDNNPHIADLSDINRPTKLAEKFSELYDNEWTNCFEVLTKHGGMVERDAIAHIHQACLEIYNECRDTASRDLHDLKRVIRTFSNEENIRAMKDLKESRKRRFKIDIERLKPAIQTKMEHALKGTFKEPVVADFWTKCLEICWLMVIQDPPVSIVTRHNMQGDMFNATLYRDYTKRGKYVEYIVWPALLLTEGGSILAKGVAQGIDVRTEMKEDISKPDAEKNMQQANAHKSVGAIQSDSTKSTKDKDSKAKEQSLRNDMKQLVLDAKSTSDGEKCLQQDSADTKEYSIEEGNHARKPPKECSTTQSLKLDVYTNANEGKCNPLYHGGKQP